jgi:hypothetical protein
MVRSTYMLCGMGIPTQFATPTPLHPQKSVGFWNSIRPLAKRHDVKLTSRTGKSNANHRRILFLSKKDTETNHSYSLHIFCPIGVLPTLYRTLPYKTAVSQSAVSFWNEAPRRSQTHQSISFIKFEVIKNQQTLKGIQIFTWNWKMVKFFLTNGAKCLAKKVSCGLFEIPLHVIFLIAKLDQQDNEMRFRCITDSELFKINSDYHLWNSNLASMTSLGKELIS